MHIQNDVIALDLGKKRTGVARIHPKARIAESLDYIEMTDLFVQHVQDVVDAHKADAVVIGMPRGLDGQTTDQTRWADQMLSDLKNALSVPVFAIDEAGTTKAAEARMSRGESIDSVAAGIIAEDFIAEVAKGNTYDAHV